MTSVRFGIRRITVQRKMAAPVQGMRTFGERPKPFQLEDGGEFFYVGSEVSVLLIAPSLSHSVFGNLIKNPCADGGF